MSARSPSTAELRRRIENRIQLLVDALDALDAPDMDREDGDPAEENGDLEPSLGALMHVDQRAGWSHSSSLVDGETDGGDESVSTVVGDDAVWRFRGETFRAGDSVIVQLCFDGVPVDGPFPSTIERFVIGSWPWRREMEAAAMVVFAIEPAGTRLTVECKNARLKRCFVKPGAPTHPLLAGKGKTLPAPSGAL